MPEHIAAAAIEIPCSKLQGIFDRVEFCLFYDSVAYPAANSGKCARLCGPTLPTEVYPARYPEGMKSFVVPAALPLDLDMLIGFGISIFYNFGAPVFRICGFRNP
jgi:hypothetical protein